MTVHYYKNGKVRLTADMTPAERRAEMLTWPGVKEAIEKSVAEAPPMPEGAKALLRELGFPFKGRPYVPKPPPTQDEVDRAAVGDAQDRARRELGYLRAERKKHAGG